MLNRMDAYLILGTEISPRKVVVVDWLVCSGCSWVQRWCLGLLPCSPAVWAIQTDPWPRLRSVQANSLSFNWVIIIYVLIHIFGFSFVVWRWFFFTPLQYTHKTYKVQGQGTRSRYKVNVQGQGIKSRYKFKVQGQGTRYKVKVQGCSYLNSKFTSIVQFS